MCYLLALEGLGPVELGSFQRKTTSAERSDFFLPPDSKPSVPALKPGYSADC